MTRLCHDVAAGAMRASGMKVCPNCNRLLPADQVVRKHKTRGVMRCLDCLRKAATRFHARKSEGAKA